MKPLPRLEDEAAMLERGRRSALAATRNDAEAALRDAYTALTAADWPELAGSLAKVDACVARLHWVAEQWQKLNDAKEAA